jgi:hypothetical protein
MIVAASGGFAQPESLDQWLFKRNRKANNGNICSRMERKEREGQPGQAGSWGGGFRYLNLSSISFIRNINKFLTLSSAW